MSEEKIYPTIKEWFEQILDTREIRIFKFNLDGQCWAGNPKRKTNTRISIAIPRDIAHDNLKFLNEWNFFAIAIPKELIEKLKKEDDKK